MPPLLAALNRVDPGVTPATVEAVDLLIGWSREHATGPAMPSGFQVPPVKDYELPAIIQGRLVDAWRAIRQDLRLPAPEGIMWLAGYVSATSQQEYAHFHWLICEDTTDEVAAWRAVGVLAPLARIAGLTLDEARTRAQEDTLDPDALMVLAALRGWKFPPLSFMSGI